VSCAVTGPDPEDRYATVSEAAHGQSHPEVGPTLVRTDGRREWLTDGRWHRTDGPAIEHPDGTAEWWVEGRWHRGDGPALIDGHGNVHYVWQDAYIADPIGLLPTVEPALLPHLLTLAAHEVNPGGPAPDLPALLNAVRAAHLETCP
jgi:hypothetical protein